MIFAFATDDRGLIAFTSEREAVAYCEGLDVEEGRWQFYASDGRRLVARFTHANVRGRVGAASGAYVLEPGDESAALRTLLDDVAYVEGCGLSSVADVRRVIG